MVTKVDFAVHEIDSRVLQSGLGDDILAESKLSLLPGQLLKVTLFNFLLLTFKTLVLVQN